MKYSKSDYVARISTASPAQLIIITYELAIEHMTDAINLYENSKLFQYNIKKAMDFLASLMDSLDMSYEISPSLMSVYIYVNKLLIQSKLTGKIEPIIEARKNLSTLQASWTHVAKVFEVEETLMENSQQIYAGLTYGNGELREYIEENCSRGYRA